MTTTPGPNRHDARGALIGRDLPIRRDHLYIDGDFRPASGTYTVIDPATARPMGQAPAGTAADIDRAVAAARRAFDTGPWPHLPAAERAAFLARLAAAYRQHSGHFAELIIAQMGSPVSFTAQTTHPPAVLDFYAALADDDRLLHEERDGYLVHREPAGVVGIITPWNMPSKTIIMKLAPALLAGCTAVIKPAPQTPFDALALIDLIDWLDLPPGVVNVVTTPSNSVAERLVTHPGVDKIAFTGSTATGALIAALCGADIRRVSLELGGKSAMIVTEDADVHAAIATVPAQSLANSGQICSNLTRIIAHTAVYADVLDALDSVFDRLTVGDPADPATDIGPLAFEAQLDRAAAHIAQAIGEGATLRRGATILRRDGHYLQPGILTTDDPRNHAFRVEIFAPVLTVTPYIGDDHAIELANATPYGLDGCIWTADPGRALHMASRIRSGTVRVNGAEPPVHAPLGGYKRSGIGRELGPEGLAAYLETKVVATA
ncbi:aldehyde dehydrogenase family protein [Actinomadura miaoliensis]|uniref:aldehyde dehydrogenase (NAD(+)) n=1 Tax=Actinomadura miaoliensis TaxID=430685 RepID=A0ABP7WBE2_9ACTN